MTRPALATMCGRKIVRPSSLNAFPYWIGKGVAWLT
jgi:hypothetical protein